MHDAPENWIAERAREYGFGAAGIAAVEVMDPTPLQAWLTAGYGAEMTFLARHLPLRANLRTVLPGARSVICVAMPYAGPKSWETGIGAVACYARGVDYHLVVHERLERLWADIVERYPDESARIFVDSGPLPERELARRAGVGWIGKHGCLITPAFGSYVVLGEILTTLALPPSMPMMGECGDCDRCMRACPTGALVAPGTVDARRCLSYLTIEHRGPLPRALRPALGTRLFGCDACQQACPHNQLASSVASPLQPELPALDPCAVLTLTPEAFTRRFHHSPLRRAKRAGLLRNACTALGNQGNFAAIPALMRALYDLEPLVRAHAAWALGVLNARELLSHAQQVESDPMVREEIEAALTSLL